MPYGPTTFTWCALLEVAQVIGGHAGDGAARVVLGHALHGEREIVVARPLALARTRHRVEAQVVRPAARVAAGRNDADRLAFEHGKRGAAEVEHDVPDVGRRAFARQAEIAGDGRDRRLLDRVEIDVRMRGRPRRRRGAALARGRERRDAHDVGRQARRIVSMSTSCCGGRLSHESCCSERVRVAPSHAAPVVDGSGRAGRDALVAAVALVDVDDVVPGIVRHGVDRTGLLARVAADADLRIDEVLPDHLRRLRAGAHCVCAAACPSIEPHVGEVGRLVVDRRARAARSSSRTGPARRRVPSAMRRTRGRPRSAAIPIGLRVHSAAETTLPAGSMRAAASGPMRRWNALCGALSRTGMPASR